MGVPPDKPPARRTRRLPNQSVWFDVVIPGLFIVFAVLLLVIVIFALGVLTGFIHYQ